MKNLILFLILTLLIPATVVSQVKINEVFYATGNDTIELKNFDSQPINITGWRFCSKLNYLPTINDLTIVGGGSLNIPAGGILVLTGFNLDNTAADLGLYLPVNSNADFATASFMVDFVQWGSAGQSRESVAVSKGIWSAGDFVPTVTTTGSSIEYDGEGNSASDWFDQANPTIGAENGIVTSVNDDLVGIPDEFTLAQNYPNPFNPSTFINYTIPQSAILTNTRLEIFNVLGQKVRTLINSRQSAGAHSVQWDGRDDAGRLLVSGVFIYRLKMGNFVDMKKMLFVK